VFGILTGPVAAVPGKTLFEAVAGPLRDPERRLVAGIDLQPDPGDAEAAVSPRRGGTDGLRGDAPPPLPGSYPVGQLGASRPVGHQPDRADKLPAAQDADGELASRGTIPCRQRRLRVAQRVGPGGTRTPQGRVLFLARGLREQGGIARDQDTHVQAVPEIQLHEPYPSPAATPAASEYSRGSSSRDEGKHRSLT
jgi:hypothetical protein